jgi:hypothetical protein
MLVNTSGKCNLVLHLRASRRSEGDLCQISLDTEHTTTDLRRSNIDEQLLAGSQFLDLELAGGV